ncbi:hypothetical protein [Paraburkholderia sediminicola]|uniref:hypothetical protein n=1 Tax=Paraburkholderia sediminicola TaxID=458836 RepID=UPI0038BD3F6A
MTGQLQTLAHAIECSVERRLLLDSVEKVAAWPFQFTRKKIDLSDRPTTRSRTVVKGKKTPENLATETDSDFFNSIGQYETFDGHDQIANNRWHMRAAERYLNPLATTAA